MKVCEWCLRSFLIIITFPVFYSCKTEEVKADASQYHYFPKTNVYYDVNESEYIYSLDSGRVWQKVKNIKMAEAPVTLGGKIIIEGKGIEIWKDNESHRALYGGTLYNILTRDTALLAQNPVAKTKDIKKPSATQETEVTEKKKKNFLQRLFGKKNK